MSNQAKQVQIEAEALAKSKGYRADQITQINVTDAGKLASIGLGADEDGMGRFVLNFAL